MVTKEHLLESTETCEAFGQEYDGCRRRNLLQFAYALAKTDTDCSSDEEKNGYWEFREGACSPFHSMLPKCKLNEGRPTAGEASNLPESFQEEEGIRQLVHSSIPNDPEVDHSNLQVLLLDTFRIRCTAEDSCRPIALNVHYFRHSTHTEASRWTTTVRDIRKVVGHHRPCRALNRQLPRQTFS